MQHTVAHCNTLQHTVTHCNTLQHNATHCSTLQHNATHCNTLQHTATQCTTLHHTTPDCNTVQHTCVDAAGCSSTPASAAMTKVRSRLPLIADCRIFSSMGKNGLMRELEKAVSWWAVFDQIFLYHPFDWCRFYYFIRNSLVNLLEALFTRILLSLRSRRAMTFV